MVDDIALFEDALCAFSKGDRKVTIPAQYQNRSLYHFTHLDNIESILREGALLSKNEQIRRGKQVSCSIANDVIQMRRASMTVPCGAGGTVHDYVPLYFGQMSPMLLALLNSKNVDQPSIVYFSFPMRILENAGVVFTDAAANAAISPSFFDDPLNLDQLHWEAIDSLSWKNSSDEYKKKRMAEVLYPASLPLLSLQHIVVWNESIRTHIQTLASRLGISSPSVQFSGPNERHYYLKFWDPKRSKTSLVSGPRMIRGELDETLDNIFELYKSRDTSTNKEFESLNVLLNHLAQDMSSIDLLEKAASLKQTDAFHNSETIKEHTVKVVKNITSNAQFSTLASDHKLLIQLAGYLHDCGKIHCYSEDDIIRQDADHNLYALPIVTALLKRVANWELDLAQTLVKIICYSDIVGDIIGKNRKREQLLDVVKTHQEFQILKILAKADIDAINPSWWDESKVLELESLVSVNLGSRTMEDEILL